MGLVVGSPSNFKLKPEYSTEEPGLPSEITLASKPGLASKGTTPVPPIGGSFAYDEVREQFDVAAEWDSHLEILNVTNEGIKQGLRDLGIFVEEEP